MRKTYRVFCSDCKKTTKINISYEMSNETNSDSLINYCPSCGHSLNSETLFKFEYSEYDTNFETGEHSSEVKVECYDEDIEHLIERFKEENFHLLYRNNEGEFPIVFWKSKGLPNQTTFRIIKYKYIKPDQDRITEEMNYC